MSHKRSKKEEKKFLPSPKAKLAYRVCVGLCPACLIAAALWARAQNVFLIVSALSFVGVLCLRPFVYRCPYCGYSFHRFNPFRLHCPRCGKSLEE